MEIGKIFSKLVIFLEGSLDELPCDYCVECDRSYCEVTSSERFNNISKLSSNISLIINSKLSKKFSSINSYQYSKSAIYKMQEKWEKFEYIKTKNIKSFRPSTKRKQIEITNKGITWIFLMYIMLFHVFSNLIEDKSIRNYSHKSKIKFRSIDTPLDEYTKMVFGFINKDIPILSFLPHAILLLFVLCRKSPQRIKTLESYLKSVKSNISEKTIRKYCKTWIKEGIVVETTKLNNLNKEVKYYEISRKGKENIIGLFEIIHYYLKERIRLEKQLMEFLSFKLDDARDNRRLFDELWIFRQNHLQFFTLLKVVEYDLGGFWIERIPVIPEECKELLKWKRYCNIISKTIFYLLREEPLDILKKIQIPDRAFILWDHANLFRRIQDLNLRIDYILVRSRLFQGYHFNLPLMYLGKPSVEYPQKQKFIDMIQRKGWKVINQALNFHPSWTKSQKEIQDNKFFNILDHVKYYNVKKAIIVSSDAVFVEFLVELKKYCIDIEVWTFRESISRALIEEVGKEHIYFLDDIVEEISLR